MLLDEWLSIRGISLKRLERAVINPRTGEPFSYTTLFRLRNGETTDSYLVGKAISEATGGEVSIAELCDPAVVAAARSKRPPGQGGRRAAPRRESTEPILPAIHEPLSPAAAPRTSKKRARRSGSTAAA
jgi:hypothetical protein